MIFGVSDNPVATGYCPVSEFSMPSSVHASTMSNPPWRSAATYAYPVTEKEWKRRQRHAARFRYLEHPFRLRVTDRRIIGARFCHQDHAGAHNRRLTIAKARMLMNGCADAVAGVMRIVETCLPNDLADHAMSGLRRSPQA